MSSFYYHYVVCLAVWFFSDNFLHCFWGKQRRKTSSAGTAPPRTSCFLQPGRKLSVGLSCARMICSRTRNDKLKGSSQLGSAQSIEIPPASAQLKEIKPKMDGVTLTVTKTARMSANEATRKKVYTCQSSRVTYLLYKMSAHPSTKGKLSSR